MKEFEGEWKKRWPKFHRRTVEDLKEFKSARSHCQKHLEGEDNCSVISKLKRSRNAKLKEIFEGVDANDRHSLQAVCATVDEHLRKYGFCCLFVNGVAPKV